MLREKIEETNVLLSNEWKVSNTMHLIHILGLSDCAPLWKMSRKNVNNWSTKKEVHQFKVACVSYMNLIQSKAFKEQIYKCMSHQFDEKITATMRKTIKHNSTREIYLIMYYKNGKSLIFKVLGVFVYCFIEKYVCIDDLCLQ